MMHDANMDEAGSPRGKETAIFLYIALMPRVLFVERRSPLGLALVPVTGR
jgi:hypothetical protein